MQPHVRASSARAPLRFQSSTRQTDFATRPEMAKENWDILFQSSTRQTDFATTTPPTSMMRSAQFQSSTRQTDFATGPRVGGKVLGAAVSILYEADRLCNFTLLSIPGPVAMEFQSSTRQTDFATPSASSWPSTRACFNPLRGRQTLQLSVLAPLQGQFSPVSILYEADRLCNGIASP